MPRATAALGTALILLGLALNPWTVARFASADGSLDPATRLGIWIADLLAVAAGGLLVLLREKIPLATILINAAVFALLLALVEVFLVCGRKDLVPAGDGPLLGVFRELYAGHRNIVQYSPECARFDERLGYTLRPGSCTFANAEFSSRFEVNRRGLRDDEASLDAPEVVVLGDSIAMGWGVEQDEAFPQLIEERSGLSVLNAAISSYGTAREVASLAGLDTRRMRWLAIQYCRNDFEENRAFRDAGNELRTMSAERYASYVERHRSRYLFGSHILWLMKTRAYSVLFALTDRLHPGYLAARRERSAVDPGEEAEVFLDVLRSSPADLASARVLVFELNVRGENDPLFVDALKARLAAPGAAGDLSIEPLDLSTLLEERHFYPLDGHLNAEGHRRVAEALLGHLELRR